MVGTSQWSIQPSPTLARNRNSAPEAAAEFKAELVARLDPIEVMEGEVSPVIGAHAGPGTVGVAFYTD